MNKKMCLLSCFMLFSYSYSVEKPVDNSSKQKLSDKTYSIEKLKEAAQLVRKQQEETLAFLKTINPEQMNDDIKKNGEVDEHDLFMQLHRPLMFTVGSLSQAFGNYYLNVTESAHTAVDTLPFYVNPETNKIEGLILIRRPYTKKWSTLGGFMKYGEQLKDAGIREAYEEAKIHIDKDTMHLLEIYDNPTRDPRKQATIFDKNWPKQVIASAFTGLTYDFPEPTTEAHDIYILKKDAIENTKPEEWFAHDHRDMALKAFEFIEQNEHYAQRSQKEEQK